MILNGIPLFLRKISRGRIVPPDHESSEDWVIPPGSVIPFWIRKLLGRKTEEEDVVADGAMGAKHDSISEPNTSMHEKPTKNEEPSLL